MVRAQLNKKVPEIEAISSAECRDSRPISTATFSTILQQGTTTPRQQQTSATNQINQVKHTYVSIQDDGGAMQNREH